MKVENLATVHKSAVVAAVKVDEEFADFGFVPLMLHWDDVEGIDSSWPPSGKIIKRLMRCEKKKPKISALPVRANLAPDNVPVEYGLAVDAIGAEIRSIRLPIQFKTLGVEGRWATLAAHEASAFSAQHAPVYVVMDWSC